MQKKRVGVTTHERERIPHCKNNSTHIVNRSLADIFFRIQWFVLMIRSVLWHAFAQGHFLVNPEQEQKQPGSQLVTVVGGQNNYLSRGDSFISTIELSFYSTRRFSLLFTRRITFRHFLSSPLHKMSANSSIQLLLKLPLNCQV